jgi:hypothetical protein
MAPAYDIAICYSCSGENGVRFVSRRLVAAEISVGCADTGGKSCRR